MTLLLIALILVRQCLQQELEQRITLYNKDNFMPTREQKSKLDPVILVALGIGLVTFAIVMFFLQSQGVATGPGTNPLGQIFLAFMTGITTGGLSCLAVQGG